MGLFFFSFIDILKNSVEDKQEGTETIFLSCAGFAGLAAIKSIKSFFVFFFSSLPKSADSVQNAQKGWLCGIKLCYYYLDMVTLQGREKKKKDFYEVLDDSFTSY